MALLVNGPFPGPFFQNPRSHSPCWILGCPAGKNDRPAEVFAVLLAEIIVLLKFWPSCRFRRRPAEVLAVLPVPEPPCFRKENCFGQTTVMRLVTAFYLFAIGNAAPDSLTSRSLQATDRRTTILARASAQIVINFSAKAVLGMCMYSTP
jgi:hypothetical protein